MLTLLLDETTAPLKRLALWRAQMDASSPGVLFHTQGNEVLVYPLVGCASLTANGKYLGILGGRRHITERVIHAARFLPGSRQNLLLNVQSYAADVLIVTSDPVTSPCSDLWPPYVHYNDAAFHDVGTGCYRRTVAEVPTPEGYAIHCGETLSDGTDGSWSSWPSHCAPEEVGRYKDHEELFFVVTPTYFALSLCGQYCTGKAARGMYRLNNGEACVMPLGAHELAVCPPGFGYYAWFYISFLKKQYNKYATDVKVYEK